jgi:tetratricopeptide (TPR) repeat protein
LLVAIAGSIATIVLGAALGRYRAPIAASLLPLAGAGVVRLWSWITARRWVWTGVAATATALYLVWAASGPPGREPAKRARMYARLGADWHRMGEPAMASFYLQESLRLEPKSDVEAQLGQALLAAGDPQGALEHLDVASRSMDSRAVRELRARALAAVGRRDEALAAVRSAQTSGPEGASARELLERLEHGGAVSGAGREAKP